MTSAKRRRHRRRLVRRVTDVVVKVFRQALAVGRTEEGWLAIEGTILFREALRAAGYEESPEPVGARREPGDIKVHTVLATQRRAEKLEADFSCMPDEVELIILPEQLFERVAQTETSQGIAALVELPEHDLDILLARPNAMVVVACAMQDPGNLGSILRSSYALGASALISLPDTVSPFNPKAVRASAGAIFYQPVFPGLSRDSLFERFRRQGLQILATDREGTVPIAQADLRGPVAILIGREATGLAEDVMRLADARIAIPIRRGTDSLNAAAAGSILLYEAARQRGFSFHEPV